MEIHNEHSLMKRALNIDEQIDILDKEEFFKKRLKVLDNFFQIW